MKTDNNQERMDINLKEMREDIKSGQAEMRSIVVAFQEKIDTCIASRRDDQKETVSFQETTEAHLECEEQTSVTMESEQEHQVAPKEDAAVIPVGGLRKWLMDRNLAAGRRQKAKGRIQKEIDCRRQEEDPPCKSGMAQGKLRRKGLDQETGRTRNPETTKGHEETGKVRNTTVA
jgi:hypothetical protein